MRSSLTAQAMGGRREARAMPQSAGLRPLAEVAAGRGGHSSGQAAVATPTGSNEHTHFTTRLLCAL